ncbi:MAG: PTS sugar transporter subunit IIA [Planctomycetes bacterium]|nr:PTS sugar transporter subunit IIA [Planctomycetota bacterium]
MKFSDFIIRGTVIKELKNNDKKDVIQEMVETIKSVYKLTTPKTAEIVEALMKREKIGSTGIGHGVAVPHAKIPGLKTVLGAFGRSRDGIDFNAIDGAPVNLVFTILAPPDRAEANLQALQRVSQSIRQANFCKFLKEAKDIKEIVEIFKESDENIK